MATPKAPADPIDARLVRKLADILNDTNLSEIEVEHGELKIRVARQAPAPAAVYAAPAALAAAPIAAAPVAAVPAAAAAPAGSAAAEAELPAGDVVKSPMVGTVYLQPSPGAASFAKVGDRVEAGQTLLIIEAMKTMNPIAAPKAGVVVKYLVIDSQPVEFGEPLVVIG